MLTRFNFHLFPIWLSTAEYGMMILKKKSKSSSHYAPHLSSKTAKTSLQKKREHAISSLRLLLLAICTIKPESASNHPTHV